MVDHLDVRRGAYADSVSLMQVSRRVGEVAGVDKALVAMGTALNLELLAGMGFATPDAGPNDMVVAVRAQHDDVLAAAVAEVDAALAASSGGGAVSLGDGPPPRTVRDAAASMGAAATRGSDAAGSMGAGDAASMGGDLALVSVPGEHAYLEALDALRAGLHVMLFSDNVPVEAEVALKAEAADRGLLVMGPDAGTAIVSGVGLGFADVVRPGPVGIVAASGTGAQQLSCLLDEAGVGVSHLLGVGGRDLSEAVGGRSTLQALRALDEDPATELVVVLSKPPAPGVAGIVRDAAEACTTPVVLGLLGPGQDDLTAITATTLGRLGVDVPAWPTWGEPSAAGGPGRLVGLFAGGTLCAEALLIVEKRLGPVHSNVTADPDRDLGAALTSDGHVLVDLGEDEHTRGRPHPMIDGRLRLERLEAEAAREDTRVLLLDVVLGHGAHADPASELAPAIGAARRRAADAGRDLAVVVSLCGSTGDPQGRDGQARALADAGAQVFASNAQAARAAAELAG